MRRAIAACTDLLCETWFCGVGWVFGCSLRLPLVVVACSDLVDNWQIDLAAELDEYLGDLEHLTYNFDDSKNKNLNFAEAALLIQGSACVYSKKVEYLYSLLFQTLEALIAKRYVISSFPVSVMIGRAVALS